MVASSRKPSPPPPCASGTAMPVMPASARRCHSPRSKTDQLSLSSSLSRSWVAPSLRIWRASSRSDCWSSVSAKSMHPTCSSSSERAVSSEGALSSEGLCHAEAEDGDEVALHLVGAAAEREDQRAAIGPLDPSGEQGSR